MLDVRSPFRHQNEFPQAIFQRLLRRRSRPRHEAKVKTPKMTSERPWWLLHDLVRHGITLFLYVGAIEVDGQE